MDLQQLWILDDDTEDLKTSFMHSCIVFNFGGANRVFFFFLEGVGGRRAIVEGVNLSTVRN
jgi:hypothetical protein